MESWSLGSGNLINLPLIGHSIHLLSVSMKLCCQVLTPPYNWGMRGTSPVDQISDLTLLWGSDNNAYLLPWCQITRNELYLVNLL